MTDIDAAEEEQAPRDAERKQHAIAQDQLLGRLARAGPDQLRVTGEPQQEGDDRERVPDDVRRAA